MKNLSKNRNKIRSKKNRIKSEEIKVAETQINECESRRSKPVKRMVAATIAALTAFLFVIVSNQQIVSGISNEGLVTPLEDLNVPDSRQEHRNEYATQENNGKDFTENESETSKSGRKKGKSARPKPNVKGDPVTITESEELGKVYSTDTESWSDDGKLHCIKDSEDQITCHNADDEEHSDHEVRVDPKHHTKKKKENAGDKKQANKASKSKKKSVEPKIVKPKVTSHNGMNSDLPTVKIRNVNDFKPLKKVNNSSNEKSNVINKKTTKSQKDDKSYSSQKDDKSTSSSQKMKLDWGNIGVPNVVNSNTGERKSVQDLTSDEEVDIESLISIHYTPNVSNHKKKTEQFESVQQILEDLANKDYLNLESDNGSESHTLWPNDNACRKMEIKFGMNIPEVDLVSYPQSGSHWLRYLLEAITGIFTGRSEVETKLLDSVRPGDGEPSYTRRTLTSITDSLSSNKGVKSQVSQGSRDGVPAILLIRDPQQSITRNWISVNSPKQKTSNHEIFDTEDFHKFFATEIKKWQLMYTNRLIWSKKVHVVHYEHLRQRPLVEILKILQFLEISKPSTERIDCTKKYIYESSNNERTLYDPYTTLEQDALWSATTRVSGLLSLHQFQLPSYFIHPEHYPPDRAYREHSNFKKKSLFKSRQEL